MNPGMPAEKPAGMTLQRFAELVDAYGADARRWPLAERAAAQALVAADPAAAALQQQAAMLDAMLDADVAAPASHTARRALMAALPARGPALATRWQELLALLGGWRIALPALAVALVAGVNIGATVGTGVLSSSTDASAAVGTAIDSEAPDDSGYRQGFAERLILDLQNVPQ